MGKYLSCFRFKRAFLSLLIICFLSPAQGWSDTLLASKVKAAYLYHLTQFVEWTSLPSDYFHLCVMGDEQVGELLTEIATRKVKGRTIQISLSDNINPTSCHLLFIGRSEAAWRDVVNQIGGASVLTVCDIDAFASAGGVIGFYQDAGKIKLEINPQAAQQAHLKISAKLLEMARHTASRGQ